MTEWPLLLRAFGGNFIAVPLIGLLCSRAFHLPDAIATGLLLMAIAPGVPFVILSGGRKSGGSHELAIALALLMPAISTITAPLTSRVLLPAVERPEIPLAFVSSLLFYQLAPLLIGALAAWRIPLASRKIVKPLGYLTFIALLVLLVLLIPAIVKGFASALGTFGLLAMLLTVIISLAIGWILGGAKPEYRRTLAIGTALRNPGLAMIIATARFPGTNVAAAVAAYFVVQAIVTSVAGIFFKRPA